MGKLLEEFVSVLFLRMGMGSLIVVELGVVGMMFYGSLNIVGVLCNVFV